MNLRDLMTRNPICITEDVTLEEAAKKMLEADVGFLPVVEGSRDEPSLTPLGVITDRDIVVRGLAKGMNPQTTKVAGIFTRETVFAYEDDTAREALDTMQRHLVGRLLVANRNDELAGVVTMATVAPYADDDLWDGTTDQVEKVPSAQQAGQRRQPSQ